MACELSSVIGRRGTDVHDRVHGWWMRTHDGDCTMEWRESIDKCVRRSLKWLSIDSVVSNFVVKILKNKLLGE